MFRTGNRNVRNPAAVARIASLLRERGADTYYVSASAGEPQGFSRYFLTSGRGVETTGLPDAKYCLSFNGFA